MIRLLILSVIAVGCAPLFGATTGRAPVDFAGEIRPLLSKHCFACHGADPGARKAKLRLDERSGAIRPRDGRPPAIVSGAPERSPFYLRITALDPAGRMPPPETGHHLTASETAVLKRWIKEGAPYPPHWAFNKPVSLPPPRVKDRGWCRTPIDAFILARLEAAGLRPNPEANRFALLRRLSLDLRGLPPTPQEVREFAGDARPEAYERWVDRFLTDPAFGERWARMWLDLARYADSAGYGSDPLRTNLWPWRDWVIQAFNRNLPFDRFTIEQLGGDLLPHPTLEQRVATAFHRNTMTNTEGGTDDEEFRTAAVKDRSETTLQVWMGLTLRCAQCHTHKYDPILNREYYQLFAFFNQTADADRPDEQPTLPLPDPVVEARVRELDQKIAALRGQLSTTTADRQASLKDEIAKLERSRPALTALPVLVELGDDRRRATHVLVKGNFLNPAERVEPMVPATFHRFSGDAPLNRLGLAQWLVSPENPLTARVTVNRFWAQLFGTGLVETEEDFGTQGALPSHPELLDWLALKFARGLEWDVKALLKLIVTSASYRQSSRITADRLARDPHGRLLSRFPRTRLEAEMVRDQALALSGLLARKLGGPSVYPPQPEGLWQAAFNGQRTWTTSKGEDRYRRGLYTFWRRTVPYPSMATFDAPSRETCAVRRSRTNTPLQAFVTLNDPAYLEMAQALARRVMREGGGTTESRARYALELCLARPARVEAIQRISELVTSEHRHFMNQTEAARQLSTDPLGPLPPESNPAELAAWTVVANILLNLDGVMVKG